MNSQALPHWVETQRSEISNVACNNCGARIAEREDLPIKYRKPCPDCGTTSRKFFASVHFTANVEAKAALSVVPEVNLLLQTLIVHGERISDGQLIEAVALPWFEILERLKIDPALAFKISPRAWEELIAGAYKAAGFDEVILTPHSGDYGRDVIAIKYGLGSVRVIDQVKAYKPGHLVTADDVRALIGVLHGDGASKGFLTTTSDFAPRLKDDPLIAPFIPARLELTNGNKLMARLQELSKKR